MLPMPLSYSIMPSVVAADKVSHMTVLSNERSFIFEDDDSYVIKIIAVNADDSYYHVSSHKTIEVTARDGVLSFDYLFEGEQEFTVLLIKDEKTLQSFGVYSLYPDLYKLRALRGDLHSHSCRSDGTRDPSSQFGHYREQGYDFVALTDHNRYYPGGEIDETFNNVNTGITRVFGEEVHCPESVIHIIHVGGKSSVADRYVHDHENYEAEIEEYTKRVPQSIPEAYRLRYAKAMWATDAIHNAGGIAIFAHPYWKPGASKIYNVRDDLAKLLIKSGMFDAYELAGCMGYVGNNRSVALWGELRAEGVKIPVVASSDVHKLESSVSFPNFFTICFAEDSSNDSIVSAVKNGYSVAVEAIGADCNRQNFCYGDLRLVSYAQFLLAHYFPRIQRIGAGLGVAMRAYAMGEADASLIEAHKALFDSFSDTFFGRRKPKLPNKSLLKFEEKWRAVHKNGPGTRGSAI